MIPLNIYKTLILRALKKLRVWEDAEDAVQNAYLLYLTYQSKLDTSNPEKLMNWLVDQEVIRIWRKTNGITSTGKTHGKILKFGDISRLDMTPEEEVVSRASYIGYNEGETLYDSKILKARNNQSYAKFEYLGQSYASKEFVLTEVLQKTKYGNYIKLTKSWGTPRVSKQVRSYKSTS